MILCWRLSIFVLFSGRHTGTLAFKSKKDQPDESEIVMKAQASVNAFMKLYGPEKLRM